MISKVAGAARGMLVVGEARRMRGMLDLTRKLEEGRTRLVGVIATENISELHRASELGADMVELRGDLLGRGPTDAMRTIMILAEHSRRLRLPTILAVRHVRDGGNWEITDEDKFDLFEDTVNHFDIADIELKSPIRPDLLKLARSSNKEIIVSYVDPFRTPSFDAIRELLDEAESCHPDVCKIAAHADSESDVVAMFRAFIDFRKRFPDQPIAAISMGALGAVTRYVFPLYGSCLTYGYVTTPTAPGMPSVADLRSVLDSLKSKANAIAAVVNGWLGAEREPATSFLVQAQ